MLYLCYSDRGAFSELQDCFANTSTCITLLQQDHASKLQQDHASKLQDHASTLQQNYTPMIQQDHTPMFDNPDQYDPLISNNIIIDDMTANDEQYMETSIM